jgi:hypothetical protein
MGYLLSILYSSNRCNFQSIRISSFIFEKEKRSEILMLHAVLLANYDAELLDCFSRVRRWRGQQIHRLWERPTADDPDPGRGRCVHEDIA